MQGGRPELANYVPGLIHNETVTINEMGIEQIEATTI